MRHTSADIYKAGVRAATLNREPDGVTAFTYLPEYVASGGDPVASTLPVQVRPRITPAGSVPPFFAGLLPEGRRLTGLRQRIKTSADDELSLLIAVGADTIGDVQIVPVDSPPAEPETAVLTGDFSQLNFDDLLVNSGIQDLVSIAGVQEKVSARMISLPVEREHERYILKLAPPEFPGVVENEHYFLRAARNSGLITAETRVVYDAASVSGLLVKRFDRGVNGERFAMEDACQALDKWPADKYNVSMEEATIALIDLCPARVVAARNIFQQVVFAWLTGNGGLHAKNISVLRDHSQEWKVAPIYDVPSSVPYNDLTLALTINDEVDEVTREDLFAFADAIELPRRAATKVVSHLIESTESVIADLRQDALPFDASTTHSFVTHLESRRALLSR